MDYVRRQERNPIYRVEPEGYGEVIGDAARSQPGPLGVGGGVDGDPEGVGGGADAGLGKVDDAESLLLPEAVLVGLVRQVLAAGKVVGLHDAARPREPLNAALRSY